MEFFASYDSRINTGASFSFPTIKSCHILSQQATRKVWKRRRKQVRNPQSWKNIRLPPISWQDRYLNVLDVEQQNLVAKITSLAEVHISMLRAVFLLKIQYRNIKRDFEPNKITTGTENSHTMYWGLCRRILERKDSVLALASLALC